MGKLLTLVIFCISLPFVGLAANAGKTRPMPRKTTLILGMDGIGYALFKKMRDGGHFRSFKNPAPLVASFPSVSDPNWAMITGAKPTESYTKQYFDSTVVTDLGRGKVVGSLMDHLYKPPDFEKFFNFKPEGAVEHFITVTWRETSALFWLDSLESALEKAKFPPTFFAMNLNTDLMSHTKGEAIIVPYLAEVDKRIQKIMAAYKKKFDRDLEVIMISDHGNAFVTPKEAKVDDYLKDRGWRIAPAISQKKDVAYTNPEAISFASFYCQPEDEEALASDLSGNDAIHVSMFKSGDNQVDFFSDGGRSRTRVNVDPVKQTVMYTVLKGKDPFDHIELFKNGPIKWDYYLLETLKSEYPYAAVRSWAGFFVSVQKPGQVLVSPKIDYVFTSKPMKLLTTITGLIGNHGSLQREESLGVFVSTAREFPPISPEQFTKFVPLK